MLVEYFYWILDLPVKIKPINIGNRFDEISDIIQPDSAGNEVSDNLKLYNLKAREKFHVFVNDGLVERIMIFDTFKFKGKEIIGLDKDSTIEIFDSYFKQTVESTLRNKLLRITFADFWVKAVTIINNNYSGCINGDQSP